jgi:hypothetical protein
MSDTSYRLIHRDDDSFEVEVSRPGAPPTTAIGFATEAEADAWIAQDKRLWQAADPFSTPAGRRWRGF